MKMTKRNNQILDSIVSYQIRNGCIPTYEEIGYLNNVSSRSTVFGHMQRLLALGFLGYGSDKRLYLKSDYVTDKDGKRCMVCNHDLEDDYNFCPNCGGYLK